MPKYKPLSINLSLIIQNVLFYSQVSLTKQAKIGVLIVRTSLIFTQHSNKNVRPTIYHCMCLLLVIDQHGKILKIFYELINSSESIMYQQWDILTAKKLVINYQGMIKLPSQSKENYCSNDCFFKV